MDQIQQLRSEVESASERLRNNLGWQQWQELLLDQSRLATDRLRSDTPLGIEEGVRAGVVVFSIYELLLSRQRPTAVHGSRREAHEGESA